ncbi:MAG: hypothetical protein EXX96DRAFT_136687 [Benjaminiella poitrasii]|nr:MAG: hypothetical protein EXX96DRAFT_136687 [Benjaminiella poitrasii]
MENKWDIQTRKWCKYCKKYITNNKSSIQIHESGRSHKEAVESFLRGVYKKGREDQEEAENIRRELQRIEKAALNSVGIAERSKYSSTISDQKSSVSKSASSGYSIPPYIPTIDELRQQAEAEKEAEKCKAEGREEWAVNTQIAKVGEWETVAQPATESNSDKNKTDQNNTKQTTMHDQAPEFQDDEEDEEDLHNFKLTEKELPVNTDDTAQEEVTFKKRKLGDSAFKSRKKKPLRKKD